MATIEENLQVVKARMAGAQGVILLAVSKGHGVELIKQALAAGQNAFGENYVQEAVQKMDALPRAQWHLIGPLQSNKTRIAAERFDWVQTLASEKIARRLSEQRPQHLPPLNVLVQVNVSAEASKNGVAPQDVAALAREVSLMPRLRLRGLMAMPEPGADRSRYGQAKEIFDRLKAEMGVDTLSMGMSDDLELAIAEGATMVRVGTAIFGQRKKQKSAA